ncbi:MAG: hypothetical protein ABFQ95_00260 [Pseudomonadota bacterium]
MVKQILIFLWFAIVSLVTAPIMANSTKQEKIEKKEEKKGGQADPEKNEEKGQTEVEEKAGEKPESTAELTYRSLHLPQFVEMPEEPPESNPAQLGKLREEKEQLEILIKDDLQNLQAIKQGFEDQQSALPQHEWKEALVTSKDKETEIQQRISRNMEALEKVKNELTYLTGIL